jgi:NAD+ synthase
MTFSMTKTLTIAIAQINPTVGDIRANMDLVRAARAAGKGAELLITGELAGSGYPPEDLVLKVAFQDAVRDAILSLARETNDGGPAVILGAPWKENGKLYNAALLLQGGTVREKRFKRELPNYGVFDEKRVFAPGPDPQPMVVHGVRLGVMICEDMWEPDVSGALKENGAEILVVLNGSPFEVDKPTARLDLARGRTLGTDLPLIYVNLAGGQDELVFDGGSFVMDQAGGVTARAAAFAPETLISRWRREANSWLADAGPQAPQVEGLEAVYRAMVTGLHDYVEKNHFPGVLIGLSGGIDSALSAAVAVDALGAGRVHCVMMPSPYTSSVSLEDAAAVADILGVKLDIISIQPAMDAFDEMLGKAFTGHPADTTEENIQSRARGVTLMALSNKLGFMVLSTGNKSEMSVGYATLYGDMCGGYSVLKDVYKTSVFEISRWRNENRPTGMNGMKGPPGMVMPERVIAKPPSAELKPDQTDQDTLPPYGVLDDILKCLIEDEMSLEAITGRGHDAETVRGVWRMLDRAEYKRRQAPPGVKITSRAFGRDRRYPITNGFTGGGNGGQGGGRK